MSTPQVTGSIEFCRTFDFNWYWSVWHAACGKWQAAGDRRQAAKTMPIKLTSIHVNFHTEYKFRAVSIAVWKLAKLSTSRTVEIIIYSYFAHPSVLSSRGIDGKNCAYAPLFEACQCAMATTTADLRILYGMYINCLSWQLLARVWQIDANYHAYAPLFVL